jgi:hypothetical protein
MGLGARSVLATPARPVLYSLLFLLVALQEFGNSLPDQHRRLGPRRHLLRDGRESPEMRRIQVDADLPQHQPNVYP